MLRTENRQEMKACIIGGAGCLIAGSTPIIAFGLVGS